MLRYRFIMFTALRYLKARRKTKGFASSLLSITGIALGILALTAIIAVMNGFQLNYINNLLEISSYHVQIVAKDDGILPDPVVEELRNLAGVSAVVPFREFQVMIDRMYSSSDTMYGVLRAVDYNAALQDESFIRHLFGEKFQRDELDKMRDNLLIDRPGDVVLGYLLEQYLHVRPGSTIVVSSINDVLNMAVNPDGSEAASREFSVSTYFKSGYKEIDMNYLFTSLESSEVFLSGSMRTGDFPLHYGIKLSDRFQDLTVKSRIQTILDPKQFEIKTWRDYNKSYFGALLMEKLLMMVLVGLIFIVVGFNIFNSLRRIVYEKIEEIALLKAVGASPRTIRLIFLIEGLLIGVLGGVIGLITGLLTATHVNELFEFVTRAINVILRSGETVLSPLGVNADFGVVENPFSPRIFYFREVPTVIIPEEALFMFLFAVVSAILAAHLASKKISEVKPAEVLRYE